MNRFPSLAKKNHGNVFCVGKNLIGSSNSRKTAKKDNDVTLADFCGAIDACNLEFEFPVKFF